MLKDVGVRMQRGQNVSSAALNEEYAGFLKELFKYTSYFTFQCDSGYIVAL